MFLVQCEELRINHLTPLLVVTMPYTCWFFCGGQIILTTSSDVFIFNIELRFEKLFWEVYFERPNRVWRALKTSILNTSDKTYMWYVFESRSILWVQVSQSPPSHIYIYMCSDWKESWNWWISYVRVYTFVQIWLYTPQSPHAYSVSTGPSSYTIPST